MLNSGSERHSKSYLSVPKYNHHFIVTFNQKWCLYFGIGLLNQGWLHITIRRFRLAGPYCTVAVQCTMYLFFVPPAGFGAICPHLGYITSPHLNYLDFSGKVYRFLICRIYVARFGGWEPYNLHDLAHVSWVESVLYRSRQSSQNCGLGSR